jgi:hypothetical protein
MENNIENIEKFRLVRYFGQNGELSQEEIEKLGFPKEDYMTLNECAYQCACNISNDWIRDTPNWDDVQDAYKRGVLEAKEYYERLYKKKTGQ